MSTATDELISAYLAELEREAARLSWNARTELLEDVRSHIEVALAEMRELSEASAFGAVDAGSGDAGAGSAEPVDPSSPQVSSPDLPSRATSPADEMSKVRAMLAALGEPAEIVAAALADDPSPATSPFPPAFPTADLSAADPQLYPPPTRQGPPYPLGTAEIGAVTLLLVGGFLIGIGWLVGVVLLWTSTRWTRLEKLIGTLVLPGGVAGGLVILMTPVQSTKSVPCDGTGTCGDIHTGWYVPGWLAVPLAALIVLAPVATAVFLVNRARRRRGTGPASAAALAVIAGVGVLGLLGVVGLLAVSGSSGAHAGHATPATGYVVPVSSPAPQSGSASAP